MSIQYGYNAPAIDKGAIKMVRISDIHDNTVQWSSVPFCNIDASEIDTYLLKENDILFARTGGTVGKSFLVQSVPEPAIYAGYLIRTRYSQELCPQYLKSFMESQLYWDQLKSGTIATAQPNCNGKTLGRMLLPIPPKAEQVRLTQTLTSLTPLFQRYAEAQMNLDSLNERISSKLQKSILQEAIQGKLVPQDPNDEPASVLLGRIREEKQRLLKEGKLKKKDITDSVIFKGDDNKYYEQIGTKIIDITDSIPFDIPSSWSWCRLSQIANIYTGNSINETDKKKYFTGVSGCEYIATKDVGFDGKICYKNGVAIPDDYMDNFRIAPSGSVLMCIEGGSAGRKIGMLEQSVCFGNKLCCFAPYGDIAQYIMYYLQSPTFLEIFNSNKNGIIGGVSVNNLKQLIIPLPPFCEIKRIEKCVNQLFKSIEV